MTITTRHDKRHSHRLGFVTFRDASSLTAAIQQTPHTILGHSYDVKRAYSKDDEPSQASQSSQPSQSSQAAQAAQASQAAQPSESAESASEPSLSASLHAASAASPPASASSSSSSAASAAAASKRSKDRRGSFKPKPALGAMGSLPSGASLGAVGGLSGPIGGLSGSMNGLSGSMSGPNGLSSSMSGPNGLNGPMNGSMNGPNGLNGPISAPSGLNGLTGSLGAGEDALRGPGRELPGLEFFDEQDNNPLPATYTQPGLPPFASAGLSPFQQPAFREGAFPRGDLGLQPSPRFYTQHEAELYGSVEPEWAMDLPTSFFDGPSPRVSGQFGSVPGDQDALAFGSSRRLSRHDSLSSLPAGHGLFAQREAGMFDSMNSAGSHSGFARPFFPSQHVAYYDNYLATDPGTDDFAPTPGFFSNGGRGSGGMMSDMREGDYFNASFDDALMGVQSDKITWSQFTDWSGKEIDSIL